MDKLISEEKFEVFVKHNGETRKVTLRWPESMFDDLKSSHGKDSKHFVYEAIGKCLADFCRDWLNE